MEQHHIQFSPLLAFRKWPQLMHWPIILPPKFHIQNIAQKPKFKTQQQWASKIC
jgi:hypothetical protein